MADLRIPQISSDPANSSIARGDEALISRNGVGYRAAFNGALFLPAYTAADSGKGLRVNNTGDAAEWVSTRSSTWTRIIAFSGLTEQTTSISLTTNETKFDEYYVVVRRSANTDGTQGMYVPKGDFASYSSDGRWRVWFSNNFTRFNWEVLVGVYVDRLYIYAR